jgi:hypothetical protein
MEIEAQFGEGFGIARIHGHRDVLFRILICVGTSPSKTSERGAGKER